MASGDLSDLSSMTTGAFGGLGASFFDSMDMPDSLEMPLSSADIQMPAQWDHALSGMDPDVDSLSIPSLGHDPWGSNGSGGSSRLMSWGLGGLGQIGGFGASGGDEMDKLAVPSNFDTHAPVLSQSGPRGQSGPAGFGRAGLGATSSMLNHAPVLSTHTKSGPSSLGGVMLGAPGDRNVTPPSKAGGAAKVASNGSSAKAKGMQDELGRVKRERDGLKMEEELQRVKRERDELEKKLREMEAAKASPPLVAPPPPESAGAAPSRARLTPYPASHSILDLQFS